MELGSELGSGLANPNPQLHVATESVGAVEPVDTLLGSGFRLELELCFRI